MSHDALDTAIRNSLSLSHSLVFLPFHYAKGEVMFCVDIEDASVSSPLDMINTVEVIPHCGSVDMHILTLGKASSAVSDCSGLMICRA